MRVLGMSCPRMVLSVCSAPLCAFRAAFGTLMLVHVVRLHLFGLYHRSLVLPRFHFDLGLSVPVPSSATAGAVHLTALGVAALGIALGVRTRACAAVFAVLYGWFVLCERTMFNNHFYLYTVLSGLLALVEARQRFALVRRAGRAADGGSCLWWERAALRVQLCIVYAYAGVAKLNSDWLLHGEPMASKLRESARQYEHSMPWRHEALCSHELALLVSLGGVCVDLALPVLLLLRSPRGRALGLAVSTLFHASNLLLWQLGEFPLVMLATNLLFLDELSLRPLRGDGGCNSGGADMSSRDAGSPPSTTTTKERATAATTAAPVRGEARLCAVAAAAHLVVQLLLPLRPLLASGFDPLDAVHTKAHTLLSWRFMAVTTRNWVNATLRSEPLGASVLMTRTYNKLHVLHANGSRAPLQLQLDLEPRQVGYMAYTAPMLLQYARRAAARHADAGGGRGGGGEGGGAAAVQVRGELWSAINGRPLQRFVDPSVDLASATLPSWRRPEWVLPLLHEYGDRRWRARLRWLRRRLEGEGGHNELALFADRPGGVFEEELPAIGGFPARALLVPLDGRLRVVTPSGARELAPPEWDDGNGGNGEPVALRPRAAPVAIPFGAKHRVESVGDRTTCWAYVYGIDAAAELRALRGAGVGV